MVNGGELKWLMEGIEMDNTCSRTFNSTAG